MSWLWVSLAIALQARSAALGDSQLATAALASPRPRECRGPARGEDGLWTRARAGDAQRYCELLARGYARLSQTPTESLAAAQAAEALVGPGLQIHVLRGRARLRLGQAHDAFTQFAIAEAEDDGTAFLDPKALHDYARAASLAGTPADAVRLYRMLVSRSALLDDAREKSVLQIEAAAQVLAYAPSGSDEALGYLAQARRNALGLSPWIAGLRLLIATRDGRGVRSFGGSALPTLAALTQPLAGASGESPVLPAGELEAVRAVLTESSEPSESRRHWELFVAQAHGENVWLAQARKKLAEASSGVGKGKPR